MAPLPSLSANCTLLRTAAMLLVGASLLALLPQARGQDMPEGVVFVTSVREPVEFASSEGRSSSPRLHELRTADGLTITTGKGGHLFLALSNGAAIGISENSEVHFETYRQAPFDARRESLTREPSHSRLSLELRKGTLAVASYNLSPLSQARVRLPDGELRIHSATCVLSTSGLGTALTAYEGSLTYYYPEDAYREFISAPQGIRITEQSARQNRIAEALTADATPEAWRALADAARYAGKRVLFKAGENAGPLVPLLVVPPDYFEQDPARPYEYIE